jgi:hypothetical protein
MPIRAPVSTHASPIAATRTQAAPARPPVTPTRLEQAQRQFGNQAVLRSGVLQRKCECGTTASGTCEECKKEAPPVQRRADGPATAIPSTVGAVLARPGRPLDPSTRSFMESRFQRDLGDVRIHTDADAARSAQALHAQAYTVGNQIVFGADRYDPSGGGRHLLAHELAHTVQQRGLQARGDRPLDVTAPGQALEQEADRAADAVVHGRPMPALTGPVVPVIARAVTSAAVPEPTAEGNDWRPLPPGRRQNGLTDEAGPSSPPPGTPGGGSVMAFRAGAFPVPNAKGPKAMAAFQRVAAAGALRATISFQNDRARRPELSQARASTTELRSNWLRKVGWQANVAQRNWGLVGGAPTARSGQQPFDPSVGGRACHLDHIVELQLGGTNIDENIQVLDGDPNMASGRGISDYLSDLAQVAYDGVTSAKPSNVTLHFTGAVPGTDPPITCAAACPPATTPPTAAGTCCQIENCATSPAGQSRTGSSGPITEGLPGSQPYPVTAGGSSATIEAAPTGSTDLRTTGASNANASELISGIRLEVLRRASAGDNIDAHFDTDRVAGRARATRIPVNLTGNPALRFRVDTASRALTMTTRSPRVNFTFPYLSEGHMTLAHDPVNGLSGRGTLTPSLPLLRSVPLVVLFDRTGLRVQLEAPPERLRTPIPHFRFTEARLTAQLLPEFHPEGVLGFEVGPRGRPVATGRIMVTADSGGLVLNGTLDAHLPRVDRAHGEVTYRNGEWTGGIDILSTQIGIPGIQSGQLRLGFTNAGVTVTGTVIAVIPGGHQVTFRVERDQAGNLVYTGDANLRVPGLRPVVAHVRYDGRRFLATARTGVDLGPLSGDVALTYRADGETQESELSGEGTLTIRRGRVNGTFTGRVRNGVFTGDGNVQVRLTDNLIGTVGISLNEQRLLRVSGELVVPQPITLFPRVPQGGGRRELFNRSLDIPILGLTLGPLGSVGLIARITAAFGIDYHFGPGTLENIRVAVAFNPLEEDAAFTADGHAELNIPAYAGVYVRLRGGLGLSALIASVTGGIEAQADLGLQGGARTSIDLHYAAGGFSLEGRTRISATPRLRLSLTANIIAEVGALGLTQEWRKDWRLYAVELGSALEFGLEAGLGYSSVTGVRLPSMDDITWIYPRNFDYHQILNDLLAHANR